jgi:hypothetical protein
MLKIAPDDFVRRNRRRRMFHVEQRLFAQAETAKQSIEHVLHACAACEAVKRAARRSEVLGNQNNIGARRHGPKLVASFGDMTRLAAI